MFRSIILFVALVLLISCSNETNKPAIRRTKVNVHLENAYNEKVVLESLPVLDQKQRKLDSASIKDRVETRVFEVIDTVENLYQIRIANSPLKVVFINDKPEIDIYIYYRDSVRVKGSPATETLQEFLFTAELLNPYMVDLSSYGIGNYIMQEKKAKQQTAYRNFVDTVSSPAAALYFFNNVDYGNDYGGLRKLMNSLHNRFPSHPGINALKKETDDYISIFEEELQVNDIAPDLTLPDSSGKTFALSSLKGKFVLLDFWAAWSANCRSLSPEKLKAWNQYKSKNFSILSVSLDSLIRITGKE